MSDIESFRNASSVHSVRQEAGGFTILPVLSDVVAIENFQAIARRALRYRGVDYEPHEHMEDGKIDQVFFQKLEAA